MLLRLCSPARLKISLLCDVILSKIVTFYFYVILTLFKTMPQRLCCVSSCTSALIDGAILHAFPNPANDSERFNVWVTHAGLLGEDESHIFRNRRICHLHFEPRFHSAKNRLIKSAIPTLYLPSALQDATCEIPVPIINDEVLPSTSYGERSCSVDYSTLIPPQSNINAVQDANCEIPVPIITDEVLPSTRYSEKSCSLDYSTLIPPQSNKNAVQDAICEIPVPIIPDEVLPSTSYGERSCSVNYSTLIPPQSNKTLVPDKVALSATKKEALASARRRLQMEYGNEFELYHIIAKTKHQLAQCQKSKAGLIQKLKIAKKLTNSAAYRIVSKKLSPAAKIFFDMQIRQSMTHPKGHRFTLDEKILALSLYKPSPKAYRLLSKICVLPKKSTLNKLLLKTHLFPGPNEVIFEHLKKRVQAMPHLHKYCTLIFDEMAIGANISYDKKYDKLKGFCDDGAERTKCFADHALVFMIRGIFKKYKQPVAYSFCSGTTGKISLKKQIKEIIEKIMATGLEIVSTTCDQGTTNMAAINMLISETKEKYIRDGKEFKGGFFEINDKIIYPIYDPPHLLKGIRNNLLTKNLEFTIDSKKKVAKWSHLVQMYKKGPGFKGLRLVPKLTARHVLPNLIPKMKVKYCAQVFSQTVSVAMGFTAETGRIPKESRETAELLLFFDKLFDSVNGNFNKIIKGKVYRSAVTPKSPHHKLWQKSLPILKSMKYLGGRGGLVPSISSWIKTIEAFQEITKKLHNLGIRSLLLRNFNQDPLENFFGSIRAHGQRNVMPSCVAFEGSYKTLLINNMVSPKSVGSNCQKDDSICLQNLKYFLQNDLTTSLPEKNIEIEIEHLNIELDNINNLLQSNDPKDIEKCAAAAYCSGWILNILYKYVPTNCEVCKKNLEGDSEEAFSKFISLKKYSNKCLLYYPSKDLLECILHIEKITLEILKTKCESEQLIKYIELLVTSLVSLNFISCLKHHDQIKKIILKKGIMLIVNDWCREVNNLLCGKTIEWDEADPIKNAARQYYIKHKYKTKN